MGRCQSYIRHRLVLSGGVGLISSGNSILIERKFKKLVIITKGQLEICNAEISRAIEGFQRILIEESFET